MSDLRRLVPTAFEKQVSYNMRGFGYLLLPLFSVTFVKHFIYFQALETNMYFYVTTCKLLHSIRMSYELWVDIINSEIKYKKKQQYNKVWNGFIKFPFLFPFPKNIYNTEYLYLLRSLGFSWSKQPEEKMQSHTSNLERVNITVCTWLFYCAPNITA